MTSQSPLVSICVPTYNGSEYLAECLSSALSQSFKDVEVLVVDDASSDSSTAIADEFAALDSRVRVIRNSTNSGLVANWNRCVAVCRGAWIKFLFQDDVLAPDCIESLLSATYLNDSKLVACFRTFIFEDGISPDTRAWYLDHQREVALRARSGRLLPEVVVETAMDRVGVNLVGEPSVSLIHRAVFEQVGPFDEDLSQLCDSEFWVRAGIHHGWTFVQRELASFRVHKRSASAVNAAERRFASRSIDLMIVLHHFLYDPAYEPLRHIASRRGRLKSIERRFLDSCHDARTSVSETTGLAGERMAHAFALAAFSRPEMTTATWVQTLDRKVRRALNKVPRRRSRQSTG